MNNAKPLFIVFEGIDGSGKTTISRMLQDHLEAQGRETAWLREPGDSQWGRKIRHLANHKESIPIEEELQYFLKDREWNVNTNIRPSLEQQKTVILDRYFWSSACYQGARGLDMHHIIRLNRRFAPDPDITFVIDVDVDTALARIKNSREVEAKLFEKKEFLQKVRANYLSLKSESNFFFIDGSGPPEEVFRHVKESLKGYLA